MLGMRQTLARRFDLLVDESEAARRHKVWIVTDRMLRQFLDGILSILLFDEGPAHNCQLFFQTPRSV